MRQKLKAAAIILLVPTALVIARSYCRPDPNGPAARLADKVMAESICSDGKTVKLNKKIAGKSSVKDREKLRVGEATVTVFIEDKWSNGADLEFWSSDEGSLASMKKTKRVPCCNE